VSRAREAHEAHQQAVSALGRTLARRAGSRCELCAATGRLSVVEVPPTYDDPDDSRAVLSCPRCAELLQRGVARAPGDGDDSLRFLGEAIWSPTLPAQLAAVRLCRQVAARGVPWAVDALEPLWLDEDVEALL